MSVDRILGLASRLGEAIGESDRCKALRAAEKKLKEAPEAEEAMRALNAQARSPISSDDPISTRVSRSPMPTLSEPRMSVASGPAMARPAPAATAVPRQSARTRRATTVFLVVTVVLQALA